MTSDKRRTVWVSRLATACGIPQIDQSVQRHPATHIHMRTHTNAHTYKRAHAWQDQPMLQNAEHTQHHRSTCLVSACSTALCCVAVLCCVVLCCVVVCCSVVWCVVLLGHSEKKDEGKKHTVGLEVAGGEAYVKTPLSSRSLWFVFTCLFFASRCSRHCGQRTCTHTHTHTRTSERARKGEDVPLFP